MAGKAAQELQNLQDMTEGMSTAQDAATTLNNVNRSRGQHVRTRDGEDASFDTPNALATGIGASLILGPVGGALLGIAQGFLGKEAKQNELDNWVERSDIYSETNDIYNQQIDNLEMLAESDEDLQQLNVLRGQLSAAQKFATSADPRMQKQGEDMLREFEANIYDYALDQETQAIEREENLAALERDTNAEIRRIYEKQLDAFKLDSKPYETQQKAIAEFRAAVNSGSPSDLQTAYITLAKALDPESVVRPEEAKQWTQQGDALTRLESAVNQWMTGRTTDDVRRMLLGTVQRLDSVSDQIQMGKQAEYKTILERDGVPPEYWSDFDRVEKFNNINVGQFQERDVKAPGGVDEDGNVTEKLMPDPGNAFEEANEATLRQPIPAPAPILPPRAPRRTN